MIKLQAYKHSQVEISFSLPQSIEASSISIVEDCTTWNPDLLLMKLSRKGAWQVSLKLKPGHINEFCYLSDDNRWLSDDPCGTNLFDNKKSTIVLSQEA